MTPHRTARERATAAAGAGGGGRTRHRAGLSDPDPEPDDAYITPDIARTIRHAIEARRNPR